MSAALPLPLRWYSAITVNQSPEGVESAGAPADGGVLTAVRGRPLGHDEIQQRLQPQQGLFVGAALLQDDDAQGLQPECGEDQLRGAPKYRDDRDWNWGGDGFARAVLPGDLGCNLADGEAVAVVAGAAYYFWYRSKTSGPNTALTVAPMIASGAHGAVLEMRF